MKGSIAYQEDPVAERYRAIAIALRGSTRGLTRDMKGELYVYAHAKRIPLGQPSLTSAELRSLVAARFALDPLEAIEARPAEVLDVVLEALPAAPTPTDKRKEAQKCRSL